MVNNKDGFTLTELIAVLVILTLLVSVGTITFINVRSKVLKKQYDNLVMYLETKAAEYANETNITTISVEDLIKEGYVTADDGNIIYNPETKESMNCYIITSTFEDGKYLAKLTQNLETEDGKCKSYTKTLDLQICNMEDGVCKNFDSSEWFADNVTLGVLYNNEVITDEAKYYWISSTGLSSKNATLTTKTTSISQDTIKCNVEFGDIQSEAQKLVKIDKEAPFVIDVVVDKQYVWVANSKSVNIKMSDGNGSGVNSIYLTDANITNCKDVKFVDEVTNSVFKTNLGAGEYSVCVKDKVGNVSNNVYKFKVEMIDVTPEAPVFTASDGLNSGTYHSSDYTLTWKSVSKGSQDLIYYYGTKQDSLNSNGNSKYIKKSEFSVIYYVKACTKSGLCSDVSSYIANVDEVKPTIDITSSLSGCLKSHLLTAILTDYESGIVGYAVTNSSDTPSSWTSVDNVNSFNLTYSISKKGSYYIHTIDKVRNTAYKFYGDVCIDDEPPSVQITPSFSCSSGLSFSVVCNDKNGCNYTWQLSNSNTGNFPNSSSSTSASAIDGNNYLWLKACDNVGNCQVYQNYLGYCDFSYTPTPDPWPKKYEAYTVCSNSASCAGYGGGGSCDPVGSYGGICKGSKYICYCCTSPTVYAGANDCYEY